MNKGRRSVDQNQGGEDLRANGWKDLPYGFRGVLSVDYLSSYLFRLAFAQGLPRPSIPKFALLDS